jgi:hypothetical protein
MKDKDRKNNLTHASGLFPMECLVLSRSDTRELVSAKETWTVGANFCQCWCLGVFLKDSRRKLASHHVQTASDGNRDPRQTADPYYPICTVRIN